MVAVYLQNSPDFIIIWLALWSIGCAPAFINYYLGGDALVHCLKISTARLVLVDVNEDCTGRVEECRKAIENELQMNIIVLDQNVKQRIKQVPAVVPEDSFRKGMKLTFPAALYYTRQVSSQRISLVF